MQHLFCLCFLLLMDWRMPIHNYRNNFGFYILYSSKVILHPPIKHVMAVLSHHKYLNAFNCYTRYTSLKSAFQCPHSNVHYLSVLLFIYVYFSKTVKVQYEWIKWLLLEIVYHTFAQQRSPLNLIASPTLLVPKGKQVNVIYLNNHRFAWW